MMKNILFRKSVRLQFKRNFAIKQSTKVIKNERYKFWNNTTFRRVFRVGRTIVLLSSFGATTYSLGQIDYIDDPLGFEAKALKSLLLQMDTEKVVIVSENDRKSSFKVTDVITGETDPHASFEMKKAAEISSRVFTRIKKAAIEEIDDIIEKLESEMKTDTESTLGLLAKHSGINAESVASPMTLGIMKEEYDLFLNKRKALGKTWSVVVLDNETPNAFVNGFLPNKMFITKGLLKQFTKDESQLAMVLGHELSHYLLGHTKNMLLFDAALKVAVVSLVSMIDITGGLGSFATELAVPLLASLLGKSFNREQETSADQFGLRLCTRSCFRPEKAVQLFTNMKRYSDKQSEENLSYRINQTFANSMMSTHPITEERFELSLQQLPKHKKAFKENGCDDWLITQFYKFVMGNGKTIHKLLEEESVQDQQVQVNNIALVETETETETINPIEKEVESLK